MLSTSPIDNAEVGAVVIGGSAGAVQMLLQLLPNIRESATIPIVTVVHLIPRRASLLPELFCDRCALPVREPCDKEPVTHGIWFAPPDYHLLIERDRTFSLSLDDPELHSRPSIDALFESAADCYRNALVGIVLTGASRDGARGVRAICHRGGRCFALGSDSASADIATMPTAAVEEGAAPATMPEVVEFLRALGEKRPTGGPAREKHT